MAGLSPILIQAFRHENIRFTVRARKRQSSGRKDLRPYKFSFKKGRPRDRPYSQCFSPCSAACKVGRAVQQIH